MQLSLFDVFAFAAFICFVISVSLYASRKEDTTEDYFLAGRGLSWWLIGFSLIASNISSEHFVGQAGKGFGSAGLAVASYEWIAAVTLVFVAIFFLPRFLRSGIYTIPEFLEYRYNPAARAIMAFFMMIAYVVVAMATVLYSGAIALKAIFGINVLAGIWLIGILAGAYTIYGGLKAVVWSDLIQGATLLLGGVLITILGFKAVGGIGSFFSTNADKLHMILPADDVDYPWTILLVGIWVPNLFYWGLNQFITQRTLGSKSVAEGQKGILFAAMLKLLIPFIIIMPGIMAWQLYGSQITDANEAYPVLMKNLLPAGLRGIMFAALFGAVMSSLDSMLNSASTIFTIDLYKRHMNPDADPKRLVAFGRYSTGVFVIIACLWSPLLAGMESVFDYVQTFWGFISPGIVAVFIFGIFVKKTPPVAAIVGLIMSIPVYAILTYSPWPGLDYTNNMGITCLIVMATLGVITALRPLAEPVVMPKRVDIDLEASPGVKIWGAAIVAVTVLLYIIFR